MHKSFKEKLRMPGNVCFADSRPCDFVLRKRFVRALIGKMYQKSMELHAITRYVNAIKHAMSSVLTVCFRTNLPTCERYARYKRKNLYARVSNKDLMRKDKNTLARVGNLIYSVHSVQKIKKNFKTKGYLGRDSVQVNVQ